MGTSGARGRISDGHLAKRSRYMRPRRKRKSCGAGVRDVNAPKRKVIAILLVALFWPDWLCFELPQPSEPESLLTAGPYMSDVRQN